MNAWKRFWGRGPGKRWMIVGLLAGSLVAGCASPNQNPYLYTGAGLGAALGAGIGAAANNRNPWKGAAIGGLLGTAAGGVVGEAYGRSQQQGYHQPQPYQGPPQSYYQPTPYEGPPPG